MSDKAGTAQQAISLPKGGGAIKGIGETFQPNLFSGTGNHSIPIATSPGRNGFGPSLSLQYSSGNGNGLFGLGWELSIPRVTRKTEKGLPRYDDRDVFVMSGAEDLVPWLPQQPATRSHYTIHRYRPRTEGLFARIERWVDTTTGDIHWRAISKDNITSVYGKSPSARLADPADASRVYEWLLEESSDAFGNHILYEYAKDDPWLYTHEDPALALNTIFDHNRSATQLYIRRIYYGNLPDPLVDELGNAITYPDGSPIGHLRNGRRYAFEVVFDYGDWDSPTQDPHPEPIAEGEQELLGTDPSASSSQNPVPIREDRFSTFRAGFEIRTLRRCRRVLMFHHFAELGGPTLVRSTDFTYRTDPDTNLSLLTEATVTGYRRDATGVYQSAGMPPVTFVYTEFRPHEQRYQSVTARGSEMPAQALNDSTISLVDLFGDGLPDVLQSGVGGLRYWRNLGGGLLDRPRSLTQIPAAVALNLSGVGFGDMGGDGKTDLLVHAGPLPGFYETTPEGAWKTFKAYQTFPSFNLGDPNVRLVDLTGDGRSDALMTSADYFIWFQCLGEDGFAPPEYIPRRHDLDQFPDVFFDDPAGRVRLADMSGDGLNDIVMLHNGRIDYWPNLGYGRFGSRITMENAPHLDVDFDPKRLFLADLNGTGCADLVYVDADRVHFWFNQSGNRWSQRETVFGTPLVTNADSVQFADVFGSGTATLLWTYDYAGQPESHYKALDFCGGIKPYVLTEMSNNMGATTKVRYAPSTKYFLEDQANGTPWVTTLPFPVQVVDKVEVIDHISKTKLVTTYKYHHGYFDGREREFRGFARVDQFDTEIFEDFTGAGLHGPEDAVTNNASTYHVPPVEARSWFHTGVYFDEDSSADPSRLFDYRQLSQKLRAEWYQGDREAIPFPEHEVETGETPHEAYRALRGAVLRTEVYARDGSSKAEHPYQVTESRYRVVQIQPQEDNHHGVYFSHQRESLSYHYERNPADPRISHAMTLEIDGFGNPLRSLAIGYGRRQPDPGLPTQADRDKQTQTFITYSESAYTNGIDDPDYYRTPLPWEGRTYELTGFTPSQSPLYTIDEWIAIGFARLDGALTIPYESTADHLWEQKRLIEHGRTRYRKNDLSDLLPLGVIESLALPGESYTLAFTPGLLTQVYGHRVTDSMLVTEGGYVHSESDANWWIPSGRSFFSPNVADQPAQELAFARTHFFAAHRSRDPFGQTSFVSYDSYDLLVTQATDPVGNRVTAKHDYRLLQPFLVTDPNGNRAEVAFDTLGLVAGTAVMGKVGQNKGDSLSGFEANLAAQQKLIFLGDPRGSAADLIRRATTRIVYDLHRYRESGQPAFAAILARETHASDPLPSGGLKVQVSLSYSDGFGREIQKKVQAEPGSLVEGGSIIDHRWVGSGWTIFNNKGKVVKSYEPFFDDTHAFRFNHQVGVSSTVFYDPTERVVATLHPNHTWEKVVFDPWRQESWDVNDTVLIADPKTDPDVGEFFQRLSDNDYLPTWHVQRQGGAFGPHEQAAAVKSAVHAATPSIVYSDSLGRSFLTVAHNRYQRNGNTVNEHYVTRVVFDIEGNQREVIDAKDRIVMRYDYDIAGPGEEEEAGVSRIHQASMEAGERWVLNDVTGQPIYAWDSRDHRFHTIYADPLRRPTESFLSEGGAAEKLIGRTVYGESLQNAEAKNQRGKVVKLFDQAGVVTTDDYDFKGNLLQSTRQFARNYKTTISSWESAALESESFTGSTTYDALNRPISATSPDGSLYRPTFNEANLLETVAINLRGEAVPTAFVTDIDYNAKGQRTRIDYATKDGTRISTSYKYDHQTFRLIHLFTRRGVDPATGQGVTFTDDCDNPQPPPPTIASPGNPPEAKSCGLQNLHYIYDPAGNITHIQDDAQQTIYFNSQVVEPHNDYTYDAIYRLIEAQGREHIGQARQPETTWSDEFRVRLQHPQDGQAMRHYTERYEYDPVGNFEQMIHQAVNGNWTRTYAYNEASQLEAALMSNRLSSTIVGRATGDLAPDIYPYDTHGNMLAMAHLQQMDWDFKDQLRHVNLGGGGEAVYVYDAGGQRARKVVVKNGGTLIEERLYLGGYEVFRRRRNGTVELERETLHIMDDKQRIALVETKTIDIASPLTLHPSLLRYQLSNHLGSASLELDHEANLISYEEYYPYGSTSYQAGRNEAEVSLKRYRYTGMERDEETGLNYHALRYYAPCVGRWASCDPIDVEGGLNLYTYCEINPVNRTDMFGTDWEFCNPFKKGCGIASTVEVLDDEIKVDEAVAGFGDTVSFGLTEKVRKAGDFDSSIDYDSAQYKGGQVAGYAHSLALGGAGIAKSVATVGAQSTAKAVIVGSTAIKGVTIAADVVDPSGWASTVISNAASYVLPFASRLSSESTPSKSVTNTETRSTSRGTRKGSHPTNTTSHVGASPTKPSRTARSKNVSGGEKDVCVGNVCAIMKNKELNAGPESGYTVRDLEIEYKLKFGRLPSGRSNPAVATVDRAVATIAKVTGLRAANAKSPISFADARAEGQYAIFVTDSHVVYGSISKTGTVSILDANVGRGWSSWSGFLKFAEKHPVLYGQNPANTNRAFRFVEK